MRRGDGEFQFVTDAAQDAEGNYYVAQYGEYDRIQKFSPEREFLLSWGEHGHEPGQFLATTENRDRSRRPGLGGRCL